MALVVLSVRAALKMSDFPCERSILFPFSVYLGPAEETDQLIKRDAHDAKRCVRAKRTPTSTVTTKGHPCRSFRH